MKIKQLRNLIRESISEVLKEGNTYAGKDAVDDLKKDPKYNTLSGTTKQDAENKLKQGNSITIGEMARIAKGFKLADENFDSSKYADKKVSGVPLSNIIDYFRENPGAEKKDIQKHFNFVRPQITNALVNGLLDAGVLLKLGAGGEVELPPAPGEEPEEREEPPRGGEEFLIGPYLDLGTNKQQHNIEDEEDEIEPTPTDIPVDNSIKSGGLSDEDYAAFIEYSNLKDRLNATKTNLNKIKRSRDVADIGPDTKDKDILRLSNTKKSLEDRISKLISSSKYLQDKVNKEKETKLSSKLPQEVEPEIELDNEDEIVAENLFEIKKMQYLAGIIK